jgi:multiple sugar transport system ATP-binding protein
LSFLALEGLTKTFADGTPAVRGIHLAIEEGEFVVLLGPSGCGKTTTLRMLAGLETPTAGRVRLGGADVTALPPSKRDVGFVFQFYALYPHLTVEENVAFPLECARVARAERAERAERDRTVAATLAHLGLTPLRAKLPRELSGGDQQRVALARAMVRRPRLFLMDEPLGTLDTDLRLEMCEFLRARQLELGVTTVYVTHDQEEAMRLADRIVVMSEGSILQAAPPAVVYDEPAHLFVARFVGSPGMNLIEGEVRVEGTAALFHPKPPPAFFHPKPPPTRGETAATTADGAGGFPLSPSSLAQSAGALRPGPAVLGVRPEGLRLERGGPIRGRVRLEEFQGATRCLHLDTALGRLVVRVDSTAVLESADCELALDSASVRLFDPGSGARLA